MSKNPLSIGNFWINGNRSLDIGITTPKSLKFLFKNTTPLRIKPLEIQGEGVSCRQKDNLEKSRKFFDSTTGIKSVLRKRILMGTRMSINLQPSKTNKSLKKIRPDLSQKYSASKNHTSSKNCIKALKLFTNILDIIRPTATPQNQIYKISHKKYSLQPREIQKTALSKIIKIQNKSNNRINRVPENSQANLEIESPNTISTQTFENKKIPSDSIKIRKNSVGNNRKVIFMKNSRMQEIYRKTYESKELENTSPLLNISHIGLRPITPGSIIVKNRDGKNL